MRHLLTLLAMLLALTTLALPAPARAAPAARLFPETGWRVEGRLLEYWEASGGLAVFGLPLSGRQRQAAVPFDLQHFERARLELHPQNARPYDVLLGRLGADLLARQGRDWRAEADERLLDGPCQLFADTGREVCGPFLAYWQSHGLELGDPGVSSREALALFGLPLTGTQVETNPSGSSVVTQWFERARFEFHPANPDPFKVLLGRLGAEAQGEPTPLPRPEVRLLPGATARQGTAVTIRARSDGAASLGGNLAGEPLAFVRAGPEWVAIAGVSALQPPGPLQVQVEATLPDGRVARTDAPLQVLDAAFPTERVNLPPAVQESLASNAEALARERAEVNAIWPVVTPEKLWEGRWIMPAEGRLTSRFGPRRSYNGAPANSFHEGADIKNAAGTPVVAPARGRVALAADNYIARGGAVILDHGLSVHSGYWHLEQVLVTPGQLVNPGDVIGLMGTRGMSTGPHLHWELRVGRVSVDPLNWIEREWPIP